ncbi:methyltransferase domain-containing protein [Chromobacterium violaceum]|uniref:methyltransferase domain-containing protein n=1 Tax=Chromobacterium violaceum TaxID=536 RepID=UPI00143D5C0B|nr:class I SAM-dependent methyltransferase [Chromobacterium violaceum]QIY79241.1 class I SAM-dependent methyltransferase [Chromobacterium violaceum]
MRLAQIYLKGIGAELGRASHNHFSPQGCVNVAPSDGIDFVHPRDLDDFRHYSQEQAGYGMAPARVDHVADAAALPFGDASLDYIVTSHVLEHIPDVISAWQEWERVLKPGGINFMVVPKRDAEATDQTRAITQLDDLVAAYERRDTVLSFPELPWRGHYHVFTLQVLLAALNWYNQNEMGHWQLEALEETDGQIGNGHTLVLSRQDGAPPALAAVLGDLVGAFNDGQDWDRVQWRARQALSQNFRLHEVWLLLSIAEEKRLDITAAREAMSQALILQPANTNYHARYRELTGQAFSYPISLIDYLARSL